MKLPQPDEYFGAIQNPRIAFSDPDLKFAEYEKDHWKLPKVRSGGFVLTYHLHRGKSHWAVRCFYRDVPELRRRYDAIGHFLSNRSDEVFVEARLLHDGMLVQGQRYPIIKMEWIDGDPLNLYIEKNISKTQAISWLPDAFLKLVKMLQSLGIAHGDLQHGNIMVTDHSLKLIDYDGIYLPELKGLPNNQQGHPSYQLPSRRDEYGPEIDRFSEIVIYIALKAVSESPSLWRKYSNGENILFRAVDFVDPDSSELISDLERIPALGPLMPKLRTLCRLEIGDVPVFEDFLSNRWHPPPVIPHPIEIPPPQPLFEILKASDTAGLLARIGHRVTVVGQITDIHEAQTRYGQPYAFVNFGDWRSNFYLVVWSATLGLFDAEGLVISNYGGKWVSITGILSSYKNRPQIEVEMPSQIEVLLGKQEAEARMRAPPSPVRPVKPIPVQPTSGTKSRWKRTMIPGPPSANIRALKDDVLNYVRRYGLKNFYATSIALKFNVPISDAIGVLEKLVREGKIKYILSGRAYSADGSIPAVAQPSTPPVMTLKDAQTLDRLYKTYPPSPPGPQSRPTVPSRTGQMIPSPGLFLGGIFFVLMAIALAVSRVYLLSFALAIAGLVVVVYALTHYSTLVPIQVMSHTSTTARLRGRCAGCGGAIQTGNQIVKTGRGWMHLRCTINAKKRVWKRV